MVDMWQGLLVCYSKNTGDPEFENCTLANILKEYAEVRGTTYYCFADNGTTTEPCNRASDGRGALLQLIGSHILTAYSHAVARQAIV